jgi:hypothetical protein
MVRLGRIADIGDEDRVGIGVPRRHGEWPASVVR